MNAKLESIERRVKRGGGGGRSDILETLAQESFDILTLLPTYIENTKDAIADMSEESKRRCVHSLWFTVKGHLRHFDVVAL